MGKLKHSKFKNTGILFELLVRQIAADTLSDKTCYATQIIKRHFKKGSELTKELKLYQALTKENFDSQYKAQEFLNIILKERAKLNEGSLRREKYNLIKSIKESYMIDDFFKYRVSNYKELASAYKLFENTETDSPRDYIECKNTIFEAITQSDVQIVNEATDKEYTSQPKEVRMLAYKFLVDSFNSKYTTLSESQPKEVRMLAYKFLVDSFNSKYTTLSESQQNILRNYINNVDNSGKLRNFVIKEVKNLKSQFSKVEISDKVSQIKLNETINLMDNISKSKVINENQVLSLLRYHELLQELRRVSNV